VSADVCIRGESGGVSCYARFEANDHALPDQDLQALAAPVHRCSWPFYFGLGAKLGPGGGVANVGSSDGVVRIDLRNPRPLDVWGPFRRSKARNVIVSLEDAESFSEALRGALEKRVQPRPAA
jgi:hypothetical protein